jgi:hypothetical protein
MNHKGRIAKLEKQSEAQRPTWKQFITDEMHERAMDTLTAAFRETILNKLDAAIANPKPAGAPVILSPLAMEISQRLDRIAEAQASQEVNA